MREAVRPYYLRWFYFRLNPRFRPQAFQDCWHPPFEKLTERSRLPRRAGAPPDLVFLPMVDWHMRFQRSQHLVTALAGMGHRCIYVSPHLGREFESVPLLDGAHRLSRLGEGIYELHVRLPREPVFHHRRLSDREDAIVEDAIGRVLPEGARDVVQVASFPLWFGVARRFRERGFPVVYDCHDLLEGFGNVASELVRAEEEMLDFADLALFSSEGLKGRHPGVKRSMLVRNAVNSAMFAGVTPAGPGDPPVVGYVGALDSWFDVEAVEAAALAHPECRFVLAGRIEFSPIERLGRLANVELLGEIPYGSVPKAMARFRVGLIPFRVNPLTLMTNPIKLYEYFSCGMPVVTTPLPEAEAMDELVYVGGSPEEFAEQVGRALGEDDPVRREQRREIARRESWAARAGELSAAFKSLKPR